VALMEEDRLVSGVTPKHRDGREPGHPCIDGGRAILERSGTSSAG
jgi:hypothetical protein